MDDYIAACRQAATDQGLDPMAARLTADGVPHEVAQTGGFCMVIEVPTSGEGFISLTRENDPDEPPLWLVVHTPDGEYNDEGIVVGDAVPTDTAAALLADLRR